METTLIGAAERRGGVPPPTAAQEELERLLARALLERDEGALEEATRRMAPAMRRIALRRVATPDDADDVIQETWLAALAGASRFEGRSRMSTWLLRILSYRAATHGARAARAIPLSQAAGAEERLGREAPLFGGAVAAPDQAADAREMRDALARALRELAPRQRRVFSLRDLNGWSSAQVCARLGISAGNERVLLHRARTHLRRRMAAFWSPRRIPARETDGDGNAGGVRKPHLLVPAYA